MKLAVHEVALDTIKSLKPLVAIIARHDRSLADQIRRAGSGVALALSEGAYSRKGNQTARFQEALASANETRSALHVAMAWSYVTESQVQDALTLIDRVVAMTWRLTHQR